MKKKEQFSIALWDRLQKDNIPHSFETRSGVIINQINIINTVHGQQIIGYDNVDDSIERWAINGNYNLNNQFSGVNLFIVWEEEQLMLEGWFNIYTDNFLSFYCEKKEADKHATQYRIACVKVSIPYTKGEGLGDGK